MKYQPLLCRACSLLSNERGVAFPVVLFALIAVTVMITGVMLSSATELAVSSAVQDGRRGLYTAEDGIEAYLATLPSPLGNNPLPLHDNVAIDVGGGRTARVTVVRIDTVLAENRGTYMIRSRSATDGQREVGAFFQTWLGTDPAEPTVTPFVTTIKAAATFGGTIRHSGSAKLWGEQTVSSRRTCTPESGPVAALEWRAEETFQRAGSMDTVKDGKVYKTVSTMESRAEMEARMLNGWTISDLAATADIKFGPRYEVAQFNGNKVFPDNTRASKYNWGCPKIMGVSCKYADDANWYPVVAIDANGGRITIGNGESGQGMLLIVNGGVLFRNTFNYRGLILVEGTIDLEGTLKVDGAIYAAGTVTLEPPDNNRNDLGGTLEVQYDECALRSVETSYNESRPGVPGPSVRSLRGRPYGWFELVR